MIVFDQATLETYNYAFDEQAVARMVCTTLWGAPHGPLEYVFTYLRDLIIDGLPAETMDPNLGSQVVLAVIPPNQDRAVGFIFSEEYDLDNVWSDATYAGQLADDVGVV